MSSDFSVLFVFILAQLDREPQSAYDLNRRAGLSLGATLPALARLEKEGLVTKRSSSKATNRPRFEFSVTPAGRKLARTGWKKHFDAEPPSDLDAALRLADLAAHYGASDRQITDFLKKVATQREFLGRQAKLDARRAEAVAGSSVSYRRLRDRCDAARLAAEAKALKSAAARNTTSERRLRRKAATT